MALTVRDEGRHDKTAEKYWRESYYFNFVDDRSQVYGFSTIGWRVNEGEVDGLLIVILDRSFWFAYPAVNRRFDKPWESVNLPAEARVGGLRFEMVEPFKQWRLRLDQRKSFMDLRFESFTPVYDYNAEKTSLSKLVAAEHYEQSGIVTGTIVARGRSVSFKGTGQRDHSWGVRDWSGVDSWRWITAQFGKRFSFNVFDVTVGGEDSAGGFVFDGRDNSRIVESKIELDYRSDGKTPRGALLTLNDERGRTHRIEAQVFHCVPLKRHEAFIRECFARFYYKGMEGCGVIERLSHIESPAEKIKYIGTAASYGIHGLARDSFLYPRR